MDYISKYASSCITTQIDKKRYPTSVEDIEELLSELETYDDKIVFTIPCYEDNIEVEVICNGPDDGCMVTVDGVVDQEDCYDTKYIAELINRIVQQKMSPEIIFKAFYDKE